jgi:type IV secretory pathway TrbL component
VLLLLFLSSLECAAVFLLAGIAPELASAFHTREDLRGIVASVLVRLCKQARAVALAAAQGSVEAPAKTRAAIQALGLVSGAAAAIPGAGKGEDEAAEDEEQQQQQAGSDDEDADEDYGQQQQRGLGTAAAGFKGSRRRGLGAVEEDEEAGPDAASSAPAVFTADVALGQLQVLRTYSMKWLRLMCRVFIDVSGCRA